MPRISHVSKESLLSEDCPSESPVQERNALEPGQPSQTMSIRKMRDELQSIDREELKYNKNYSITPQDHKRVRYVKSDASMLNNQMRIKPFNIQEPNIVMGTASDFDHISREDITSVYNEGSPMDPRFGIERG